MQNRLLEKSRHLLNKFEAERPRRHHELGSLLRQRNQQNVVLVMMVNQGHLDLFRNWVRSCDDRGIEVRSWTLVFTVDAAAAQGVEQLGFASYTDPTSYGDQCKDAVKAFGDSQFRSLMFPKTAIVKDVLDLGYRLLFQDVDVVWMKDPLAYFLHPSRQHFDALFMYDGKNKFHAPLHVNTGFFWLNPTPESIRFWTEVLMHYDWMFKSGSQQHVVNNIIVDHMSKGLKLNVLPEKDFANGHLFSITSTAKLPKDPYVIHCSWTHNIQHKIRKYKLAQLWYLDDAQRNLSRYPENEGWPSEQQELLLRAALLPGAKALHGWQDWYTRTAMKHTAKWSLSLLPLLYRNLQHEGIDPEPQEIEKLRKAYIDTQGRNFVLFNRVKPLLHALKDAGFQTMLLKGSALATLYYRDPSLRPMADVDLLVRTSQVEEAIACLQRWGWQPRSRDLEKFTEPYRQIAPSHEFTKDQQAIDLHWHVLPECCQPDADEDFWGGAVPLQFQGIPTLALQPADQLLHVCVHGARRVSASPLRWLADVAMIVRYAQPTVDWERLITQARKRRLILPVRDALSYVRENLDVQIPESVLSSLSQSPTLRSERIEYHYKRQNHLRRPLGYLPILWFDYIRWANAPRFPRNIIGFVPYMRRFWGVEGSVQTLQYLGRMVLRRAKFLREGKR